jgi:hypothetical protein
MSGALPSSAQAARPWYSSFIYFIAAKRRLKTHKKAKFLFDGGGYGFT